MAGAFPLTVGGDPYAHTYVLSLWKQDNAWFVLDWMDRIRGRLTSASQAKEAESIAPGSPL
jgi:hypothetical protein